MSSNYDIEMSLDDTLELDAVIQEWNSTGTVSIDRNDHSSTGIKTHTHIFNPDGTGEYEITVNGQTLKINVVSSTNIIDNFEDYPQGIYRSGDTISTYWSGDTGNFSRTTSLSKNGSYSLTKDYNDAGIGFEKNDSLNHPTRGDTVEGYYRISESDFSNIFMFANQDSENGGRSINNGYRVRIRRDPIKIYLEEVSSGSTVKTDVSTNYIEIGAWNRFKIDFDSSSNGNISVKYYDSSDDLIDTLSIQSDSYDNGGVRFSGRGGASSNTASFYWDEWKIL